MCVTRISVLRTGRYPKQFNAHNAHARVCVCVCVSVFVCTATGRGFFQWLALLFISGKSQVQIWSGDWQFWLTFLSFFLLY
jgi:hypothetical protein